MALGKDNQHALYLHHHRSSVVLGSMPYAAEFVNSMSGLGYSFYLEDQPGSLYLGFSLGLGRHDWVDSMSDAFYGGGAQFEVGYEAMKNLKIGFYSMATSSLDLNDPLPEEMLLIQTYGLKVEGKL